METEKTLYDELKEKQQSKKDGISFADWMSDVNKCLPTIVRTLTNKETRVSWDFRQDFNDNLKPIDSASRCFSNNINR